MLVGVSAGEQFVKPRPLLRGGEWYAQQQRAAIGNGFLGRLAWQVAEMLVCPVDAGMQVLRVSAAARIGMEVWRGLVEFLRPELDALP